MALIPLIMRCLIPIMTIYIFIELVIPGFTNKPFFPMTNSIFPKSSKKKNTTKKTAKKKKNSSN